MIGLTLAAGSVPLWAQRRKPAAPKPAPAAPAPAQQAAPPAAPKVDKAAAYYNFSLAHLYSELAGLYGNARGSEYLNKAIEYYRAAIKADPTASFLSEELSDLYIQSNQIPAAIEESESALRNNPNDLNARRILGRIYARLIDPNRTRNREENANKAIDQYQRIVAQDPKDTDSWVMLGRLYKILQNSVESESAYKKALELDADNEDALTGLAIVYNDLGDQKRATELLERIVAKNPSLRVLTALASGYEQLREYKLAAQALRRALEASQGNPEIQRALAQNLLFADELDEAREQYLELVAEDPKDAGSWFRLSQIHRQKGDLAKAREASDKAIELEPGNPEYRYNEVNLLSAEGRAADAIAKLKDMIAQRKGGSSAAEKQNRAVLLERLGLLYRDNDQPKEAVDAFREMAQLDPDNSGPRASAQIIETWRGARDLAKAGEEAESAIRKYPKDRMVRLIRANLLADSGKVDDAAAEIRALIDGKSDRETYLSLAQVYEKGKRYDEMATAIAAAEKLSETDEEKEGVLFMRGASLEKQKRFDLAEAEFRKLLTLNPDNVSALNYLGYMLADRGVKLDEALAMIQKAVDKEPNNGAYLDSLGWVFFRLNRLEEAERYLTRSVEKVPTDPTVRDHLGDVYAKLGKLKEAIDAWQSSLEQYKTAPAAEQDPAEVAKVQKKLDDAKIRLAQQKR
jgi:tetratricopeptide (TPR) repeat protein